MNRHLRTHAARPAEALAQRGWWVVDATGISLGRLASHVAIKLRGKDKPIFTPHVDTGDFVIVVNAGKTVLTGNKLRDKKLFAHSTYPGGAHYTGYDELMRTRPDVAIEKAVKGMLPKNSLGRKLLRKLKIYAGAEHPHGAQQPKALAIG
jgi:large subunit ribosomal protein L13